MDFTHALTLALLPEAMLAGAALISLLVALIRPGLRPDIHRWIACIGLVGSLASCGLILLGLRGVQSGVAITVWGGGLSVDSFSVFIAILAGVTALVSCLISDTPVRLIPARSSAFYSLVLVATAAVDAIAAQRDMVSFFIALALLLLCLVALGALVKTDPRGGVSSFEHLVEGVVGVACVLYGLALLYGVTGSTSLSAVVGFVRGAPRCDGTGDRARAARPLRHARHLPVAAVGWTRCHQRARRRGRLHHRDEHDRRRRGVRTRRGVRSRHRRQALAVARVRHGRGRARACLAERAP